jgi:hypothetical protein
LVSSTDEFELNKEVILNKKTKIRRSAIYRLFNWFGVSVIILWFWVQPANSVGNYWFFLTFYMLNILFSKWKFWVRLVLSRWEALWCIVNRKSFCGYLTRSFSCFYIYIYIYIYISKNERKLIFQFHYFSSTVRYAVEHSTHAHYGISKLFFTRGTIDLINLLKLWSKREAEDMFG